MIYIEEYCVCLMTIHVMLHNSKNALDIIPRVQLIHEYFDLKILKAKTELLEASYRLDIKKSSSFD